MIRRSLLTRASAQATAGTVIVGATVTVTNLQANFTRQVTTNNAGIYTFPALQPGLYNVKAEMSGLARKRATAWAAVSV